MPAAVQDITLRASFQDGISSGINTAVQKVGGSFKAMALGAGGAVTGFLAVSNLARKGLELANVAAQADGVSKSFQNLTQRAGLVADTFIGQLRTAAKGTISDLELMKKANEAALLIGNEGVQQLPKLLEIARASASATGQDLNFLFDSIVLGMGRQSKMILDNLGIIIDVDKANQTYADTLGKQASALTDAEKKQAFMNAVLASGNKLIKDTGGAVDLATDATNKLAAQSANLGLAIGKNLLPTVTDFKLLLGDIVGYLATIAAKGLPTTFETFQESMDKMNASGQNAIKTLDDLAKAGNIPHTKLGGFDVTAMLAETRQITEAQKKAAQDEIDIEKEKRSALASELGQSNVLRQQLLTASGEDRLKLIEQIAKLELEAEKKSIDDKDRIQQEADDRNKERLQARADFVTKISIAEATLIGDIAEAAGKNQTAIGRRFLIAQIQMLKQTANSILDIEQAKAIAKALGGSPSLIAAIPQIALITAKFGILRGLIGVAAGAAIGSLQKPLESEERAGTTSTGRTGGGRGRIEAPSSGEGGTTQQIFLTVEALDPASLDWKKVTQDNIAPAINDLATRRVFSSVTIGET